MAKQITQKSFILLLLVLAVAATAFYIVWNNVQQMPGLEETSGQKSTKPAIESASISTYDTELDKDLKSFDADFSDLNNLANDPSLNTIDKDMANFNL